MTPTISVTGLTRRYRDQLARDDVTVDIEGPSINASGPTGLVAALTAVLLSGGFATMRRVTV
jgi:hypothetical protein